MFSKFIVTLSILTLSLALPTIKTIAERATNIVPLAPLGNMAAIQEPGGQSRLYYQKPDGSIWQYAVSASFDTGVVDVGFIDTEITPAGEAQMGTLIAAAQLRAPLASNFPEIHIVYVSPANILSETIWRNTTGFFQSGAGCPDCITSLGVVVQPGSKVLYAMLDQDTDNLRVGFVSAGAPGTITELDHDRGFWQIAALPDGT